MELLLGQSELPSKPDKQQLGHEDFVQKLKETFKDDSFAVQSKSPPIHKQSLMGPSQRAVAGILWMFLEGEWSQDWVSLAKLNMLQAGSDSAVIVSRSLPQPSLDLCRSEGVWMVRPSHAEPLAQVIRSSLVQAGEAKRESVDRILMSEQLHPW